MLTQERVKELFYYANGLLIWKNVNGRRIKVGDIAGSTTTNGYNVIGIDGKRYLTHRIIYLYHKGYLPKFVDHKDNNPLNNSIENLRECSHSENMFNKRVQSNSKTGVKGVWQVESGRFVAQLHLNKTLHIGTFDTVEEATKAIEEKRKELHGSFANNG